jgi:hypothetical protein
VNGNGEQTDREGRQLVLIQERLEQFEAGSLHIAKVIHDLEELLEALQITPDPWRDADLNPKNGPLFVENWSAYQEVGMPFHYSSEFRRGAYERMLARPDRQPSCHGRVKLRLSNFWPRARRLPLARALSKRRTVFARLCLTGTRGR